MKRVLIPTDFSDTALNAAAYAIKLFEGISCEFYLFHAYKVPQSVGVLISVAEILKQESADNLVNEERRLREYLGYPQTVIHHITLSGSFHDLLPEVVHSQGIDLIAMGTHGARGLADSVLGTNATKVIGETKCPLLIVPNNYEFEGMEHLVFATDRQTDREEVNGQWSWVDWIYHHHKTKMTTLHIDHPDELEDASSASNIAKKSVATLSPVIVYRDVEETVYHEDVVEGITGYVVDHELNTSLLVLVAHKHGWLGRIFHQSVTQQLAMKNQFPLLVLHD